MSERSVLLVPAGNDACKHYRMDVPAKALRAEGYEVNYVAEYLDFKAGETRITPDQLCSFDAIVFQRPSNEVTLKLMRELTESGVSTAIGRPMVIAEFDDDLLNVPRSNPAYSYYNDPARRSRIQRAIQMADRVIVSTHHLVSELRQVRGCNRPGIVSIPNSLPSDTSWWPDLGSVRTQEAMVFSGGSTHLADLKVAQRALRDADDLLWIGHDYSPILGVGRTDIDAEWKPGVEAHYRRLVARGAGKLGLAPLEDTLFNKSKSDIRLLEYAAAGIDIVASPVGPYARVFGKGMGQAMHKWKRPHLLAALNDRPLRLALRGSARQYARSRTIDNYTEQWAQAWGLEDVK